MRTRRLFHLISYLQYPLGAVALYFAFSPYFDGFEITDEKIPLIISSINKMMIALGLALTFASLQDTQKLSLKIEKYVWTKPLWAKLTVGGIVLMTLLTTLAGSIGFFFATNDVARELSFGAIVLGIGLTGFLKTALEVYQNQLPNSARSSEQG
ncbi:MAG: hypothetical protein SynsKO_45140 [Synoicihabitans sp.]